MSLDPAALRGLVRFGLGLRPGDLDRLGDPRAVLREEAARRQAPLVIGADLVPAPACAAQIFAFQQAQRAARMARAQTSAREASGAPGPVETPREMRQMGAAKEPPVPQRLFRAEAQARFEAAMTPFGGYGERLAQFWSNHFCVSVAKGPILRGLAGAFEREAIRPHVFGRFEDMLIAVETHPAMLAYLDNRQSIGPHSRAGQRRGRGLNENLAREILELHTLGVHGGYAQADVTSFAAVITGWTFAGPEGRMGEPGTFLFNANLHEPGPQTLLGRAYAEDGFAQGRRVLADLARHPATARHIAEKLARWFVADDPPPALVAKLEAAYRKSEGDLSVVSLALIEANEAWAAAPSKLRTPQEYVTASWRALGRPVEFGPIANALRAMGQPLWQPPGPNGFSSETATLAAPDAWRARLDFAAVWGQQAAHAVDDPRRLAEATLGPLASKETRQAIARAENRPQAIALLLMSPEFQRR